MATEGEIITVLREEKVTKSQTHISDTGFLIPIGLLNYVTLGLRSTSGQKEEDSKCNWLPPERQSSKEKTYERHCEWSIRKKDVSNEDNVIWN